MNQTNQSKHLPDANRLSVLAAMILLAYALARFISLQGKELAIQLPGFYLAFQVNGRTIVAILVTGLAASGVEWLLRDHPMIGKRASIEHWFLPALTAWVIGLPLLRLPLGPLWWGGFAIGGALLMLVMVAEYIVVDISDARQPIATAGLTAISFALFLTLTVALRFAELRLFFILPALSLAGGLVCLRTLHLRKRTTWTIFPALAVTILLAQLVASLHYWPLSPITYGLVLLAPTYAVTSLIISLQEGEPIRRAIIEPIIVLLLVLGAAFLVR